MMISVKKDIRTRHRKTGEWGYWGEKSKAQEFSFMELTEWMGENGNEGLHEVLEAGQYRPYADLDWTDGITEANFEKRRYEILKAGFDLMCEVFPDGTVLTYCSSGKKMVDGGATWKVSAHYIVIGIYYTDKAYIHHLLKAKIGQTPAEWKRKGWDFGVYSKNHLFRLPLTCKIGDPRKLRHVEFKDIGGEQFLHYPEEMDGYSNAETDLSDGLITMVAADEVMMDKPADFVEMVKVQMLVDAHDKPVTDADRAAMLEKMTLLIKALAPHRANSRESWTEGLWAIRRIGTKMGQVGTYSILAHDFSKKTDGGNYSAAETNRIYDVEPRAVGVGFKRLKEWADVDTPGWDAVLTFDISWTADDAFDIELIKAKAKAVTQKEHVSKFQAAVVNYMNHFYTFIKWGRKPFIIEETFQISRDGQRVKMLDYKDAASLHLIFKNCGMVYILPGDKKPEVVPFNPYKCWLEHPLRSQKDRMYFNPRVMEGEQFADPRAYNLFDGLAITYDMCKDAPPLQDDNPWLQHILKRWCQNDVKLNESLLNRFAMQIQRPWMKLCTGLGLMSPEGSGKGLVLSRIIDIIGHKYVFIPGSPDQVLGKFNAGLEGKLVVFLDELTWGGDKEREGALKRLVTETTIGIERKGIDPIQIESCHNLWAASNEDWIMAASKKARRLELLKLSLELAGNQTAATEKIIQDILAVDTLSIAKFLYERKLDGYNARKVTQTEALRSQKIQSMNPVDAAMMQIINRGVVAVNGQEHSIGGGQFPKTAFFEAVGSSIKFMTDTKFWLKVRELFPSVTFDRSQVNGKRVMSAIFPALDVLRDDFRKMYDDPEWPFDEPDEIDSQDDMLDA